MTSLALSFNDVNFSPVEQDGQIWLTAPELAIALGYAKSDAVTQIYERNKDEFSDQMTKTITVKSIDSVETLNLSVSKKANNLRKTVRIFSLRGCHAIGFFAKTNIAKQFRKWVLDIIDAHIGQPVQKQPLVTAEQKQQIKDAVNTRHHRTGEHWQAIYTNLHDFIGVNSYHEIPYHRFDEALNWVTDGWNKNKHANTEPKPLELSKNVYELIRRLAEAAILENDEITPILLAVKMIDEKKYAYIASRVVRTNDYVKQVSRALNFKNGLNESLIDENCKIIALSTGQRIAIRPNWFNCPA